MWTVQRLMNEFVATGLYPPSFSDTADIVIPSLKFTYPGVIDTGEFDREILPYTVMNVVQVKHMEMTAALWCKRGALISRLPTLRVVRFLPPVLTVRRDPLQQGTTLPPS